MVILADAPPTEPALSSATDLLIDQVTASQQEAIETMENAGAALFDGLTV